MCNILIVDHDYTFVHDVLKKVLKDVLKPFCNHCTVCSFSEKRVFYTPSTEDLNKDVIGKNIDYVFIDSDVLPEIKIIPKYDCRIISMGYDPGVDVNEGDVFAKMFEQFKERLGSVS